MNKFLLIDIKGRRIYGTPFGIRTGFRADEPVNDKIVQYHAFTKKGERIIKTEQVAVLDFENRMRGVTVG
jgi:hypothetical protein